MIGAALFRGWENNPVKYRNRLLLPLPSKDKKRTPKKKRRSLPKKYQNKQKRKKYFEKQSKEIDIYAR